MLDFYDTMSMLLLCKGFTSHQQLRSYGDGTSVLSLIRKTGEARDRTHDPWRELRSGGAFLERLFTFCPVYATICARSAF